MVAKINYIYITLGSVLPVFVCKELLGEGPALRVAVQHVGVRQCGAQHQAGLFALLIHAYRNGRVQRLVILQYDVL
jgi:hypothetical protein